ncbi:MAG: eda [Clostridia bacterium]|jgi:2-dehydro-3-deoxyphosphogluconate aldolase/(4S)-4-hydroxy-2-oxoglutarate aldolase|nr:eda [Clostridia bacterium]
MMDKETVLSNIKKKGLVAVVRAQSADEALRITDACLEGGCAAIELTFTVPGAHKVIEKLADTYREGEILLGAGTVMDSETARIAVLSGAQYIVSPYFSSDVMKLCNRYGIPCMPGVMTIKEAVEAMEAGADILKLFPGEVFGPKMIKAMHGPMPQAKLMPTGGVDVSNVGEWIRAGAVAVGAGGSLTSGAKTGDYKLITATARQFIQNIEEARAEK